MHRRLGNGAEILVLPTARPISDLGSGLGVGSAGGSGSGPGRGSSRVRGGVAAVQLWVLGGTNAEREHEHGCAHLLEHLLFQPATLESGATGDLAVDSLLRGAVDAFGVHDGEGDSVFVGGTSQMASSFEAVDTIREGLTILEQQIVVVTLLRDVLDRGLSVAIGSETGVEPLADCSLVVAPYEVDGEGMGTIGVLGPTRMNYPQALAAVAVVSQRLGRRLSEG